MLPETTVPEIRHPETRVPADRRAGSILLFAAILPALWMMAGARGPRPEAPSAQAPWLIPPDCPFAVLMQETRFKDFARHVEGRADLTHLFVVTHSSETVYRLRSVWPNLCVVQLYKDYLENFRIHLSETPAP